MTWNMQANPSYAVDRAYSLEGVRTRRVFAFFVDLVMIFSLIAGVFLLAFLFAIPTFGLSFIALFAALPLLMPTIALLYNGISISGPGRGTIGMRMFDIQVTQRDGRTAGFFQAAIHAVLFYIPGIAFVQPHLVFLLVLLLPTFFEADKRMLHDILAGVLVTRRPYRFG